jgi:hypothetical protein
MADLRQTRTHTSSRTRSLSRSSRPARPPLHQLLSTQFPDDHSVYHHEDDEGVHTRSDAASQHTAARRRRDAAGDDSDSSSEADSSKDDEVAPTGSEETKVEEVRDGIPDEHDVEAQTPQLEKKKSSRSVKDPNLVSNSESLGGLL